MDTLSTVPLADLFFRFSTVSLLLLLAAFSFRDGRKSWPGRLLIVSCLSLACLLIGTLPHNLGLSERLRFAARLGDVPNTIAIWLFLKALLDDKFKMDWKHWSLVALWCIPLWAVRFDIEGYFDFFTANHIHMLNLFAGALYIYLIVYAIIGHKDDLVEPRRRLRFYFVFFTLLLTLIAIGLEFFFDGYSLAMVSLLKTALIFPPVIACYFWLLKMGAHQLSFRQTPHDEVSSQTLQGKQKVLFEKLMTEIEVNAVWKNPDLKIATLAQHIGTTQHTLRSLINQRLGHRNFSEFLSLYRIESVKSELLDPDNFDRSVLSIALDNGFNSLPSFNRAFKAITGETPTQFRKNV